MLNASALRSFLTTQLSGIGLLTLLPFIIMGLIFDPWNGDIIESMTAGTPYIYHPFVAAILVVLTLAVTIVTKKTTFITCVLSSGLLLGMALKQHEMLFTEGPDWRTFYTLYAFTALLSFPVIARRPTVSSWLFRTVLVLLLLDMIVTVFTPSYAVLSPLFMAYFPSHVSIIICILLIALLRMIRKLHTENAPTRKQLRELAVADPQARKKLRIQTLSLW